MMKKKIIKNFTEKMNTSTLATQDFTLDNLS